NPTGASDGPYLKLQSSTANSLWHFYIPANTTKLKLYSQYAASHVLNFVANQVGINKEPSYTLDVLSDTTNNYIRAYTTSDIQNGLIIHRNKSGGLYNEAWFLYMPETSKDLYLYNNAIGQAARFSDSGGIYTYGNIYCERGSPAYYFIETDAGADQKKARFIQNTATFYFQFANDAETYYSTVLTIHRQSGSYLADYVRFYCPVQFDSTVKIGANSPEAGKYLKATASDGSTTWSYVNFHPARAYLSVNQTMTTGNWEKILLDSTTYNPDGRWSTTNKRYEVTVAGYYLVCAGVREAAASGTLAAGVYVNSARRFLVGEMLEGGASQERSVTGSDIIYLNSGDYVELWARIAANAQIKAGSDLTWMSVIGLRQ
ncbi:MAG: hypothetical protein NC828_01610, partial [Candidatus Omnitrophica bacterium]|nr:hypothetical protein [Candidatus Omnitrophota bacterium]